MTRVRLRFVVASASTCLLLWPCWSRPAASRRRRPDPERALSLGDSNLDGKLSLEEFRELVLNGARLKKRGQENALLGPSRSFAGSTPITTGS